MSVIAKVAVPDIEFPSHCGSADGAHTVRLERVLDTGDQPTPYFWIEGPERDRLIEDFTAGSDVEDVVVVDEIDDGSLVRLHLASDVSDLLQLLAGTEPRVLGAQTLNGDWELKLEFDDHDGFVQFYRWCIEADIPLEVNGVHDPSLSDTSNIEYALTDTQRETLLTAFSRGYFDVPRDVNLIELAEEFDISDTAVSQRLRRGIAKLIAATLVDTSDGDTGWE